MTQETAPKRSPIRWLIIAWLIVAALAVIWGLNRSNSSIGADAAADLQAAGIEYAGIEIDGRDVVVQGDFTVSEEAQINSIVSRIDGVREVRISDIGAAESTTTAPPASTSTTTTTPPSQESTTTTIATTNGATEGVSRIVASLVDGRLSVSGVVPSPEVAGGIKQVTDLIYAPLVDNAVEVDPEATPATWLPNIPRAIGVLPIVGEATLIVEGQSATLTALPPRPEDAAALEGAITQLLGPDVQLTTDIEVTGKRLPEVMALATPDGRLELSGVLPDDETLNNIFLGAAAAYGAENVINNMTAGDNVERAFTVFRIPGIFAEFRAVPQWNLDISNGTFAGSLQGGATFAFGSAQLTDELRALLNIAAGVMARNPQLIATIEGHTDSVGSDESNQTLSEARAAAGAAYLIQVGIDPGRLTTVGAGESRPIATNDTEEGRAQNRRLDFQLAQS